MAVPKACLVVRLIRVSVGGAIVAWVGSKLGNEARNAAKALQARLRRRKRLDEYAAAMWITTEDVIAIRDAMVQDAQGALAGDKRDSLPMIPAFVEHLPKGGERGDFFALDLGGTNFRVRHVSISDGLHSTSQDATLTDEIRGATVAELFDFMVEIAIPFMSRVVDLGSIVPQIGFTFSFAMDQTGIAEGTLLHWTKGYTCPDGIGANPVQLLKEAFQRKGLSVEVPVLANDTVALLAAGRYHHPDCRMAVILGTGTNAAYMEKAALVTAIAGSKGGTRASEMAINTEWSLFRLPANVRLLKEDLYMDANSHNPGFQLYEKLISGMHLGEMARLILVTLAREGHLWSNRPEPAGPPPSLMEPRRLPTSAISSIHDAGRCRCAKAKEVLADLGLDPTGALSNDELDAVARVCGMVGQRAARLAAAGMLALARLQELDVPKGPGFSIAIDGGLYKHYASLRRLIRDTFEEVLGREISDTVKLVLVEDGSGDGAALLAAAESASTPQ